MVSFQLLQYKEEFRVLCFVHCSLILTRLIIGSLLCYGFLFCFHCYVPSSILLSSSLLRFLVLFSPLCFFLLLPLVFSFSFASHDYYLVRLHLYLDDICGLVVILLTTNPEVSCSIPSNTLHIFLRI